MYELLAADASGVGCRKRGWTNLTEVASARWPLLIHPPLESQHDDHPPSGPDLKPGNCRSRREGFTQMGQRHPARSMAWLKRGANLSPTAAGDLPFRTSR